MTKQIIIRILDEPALDGPSNMARDEALMEAVGRGESAPTMRLYRWDPPTVSLGYFQPFAQFEALAAPAGELAVVRRLTGGGAILHDRELTYSLALPIDHPLVVDDSHALYALAHQAVMEALSKLDLIAAPCGVTDDSTPTRGPFFCFARRHEYDLLVDGEKITGSAQRRTRTALLQHGSIVLENRFAQQPTGVSDVPFESAWPRCRDEFVAALARIAGVDFQRGEWTQAELEAAGSLLDKYAGNAWTRRV